MMYKFFPLLAVLAVFAVSISISQAATGIDGAKSFATGIAKDAIMILEDSHLSQMGKREKIRALFSNSIDFRWVARFVLGKHWRTATPQQREAYLENYKRFIIQSYSGKLEQYSGENYTIKQARQEGEPGEYLITLELQSSNEPPIYLEYRIREQSGRYQIFDIMVEGVSLITTQRSEFNSVVSNKGLDFLIAALAKKAAKN